MEVALGIAAGLGWGIALGLGVALLVALTRRAEQPRPPAKDATQGETDAYPFGRRANA